MPAGGAAVRRQDLARYSAQPTYPGRVQKTISTTKPAQGRPAHVQMDLVRVSKDNLASGRAN
jgi:hypothetical protein